VSRLAIAGLPRAGKSTLAAKLGVERGIGPRSTDDLIGLGWSQASETAAEWFDARGPLIVEGMGVPRALRKWLASRNGCPVDELMWLGRPHEHLTPRQLGMGKGALSVLNGILDELRSRGVHVLVRRV
jgi:adenylate kinase family enzyme